ncbi:MAG: Chaperone protein DnaJ [Myxococcaceae bacterium]|nr:Chaperone protein DnaJ [Myxococcaceae bacterium]
MASQRDYYEILGISQTAAEDEVKRAYRKLAIELHPDRNPTDPRAEERFKQASQAYAVLIDPEKRRRYDRLGHSAFSGDTSSSGFDPVDFDAFGEMIGGLFGDIFRGRKGRKAKDLRYDLTIKFEEAALGCEKVIELTRNVTCGTCAGSGAAAGHTPTTCPVCKGKGEVRFQRGLLPATRPCSACHGSGKQITHPCPTCKGEGVAPKREQMTVTLPAGVEDNSVRSVRGAGEHTASGEGDLHVYVHVELHPLFTRQGADVLCTVPISYTQAVLGDQLDVPTLDGLVKMKLPPGTESGKIFRLRGKGIAVFGGVGKGDQLVTVVVEVPREVSKRQQELLEELAREMGEGGLTERRRFLDKLRGLLP